MVGDIYSICVSTADEKEKEDDYFTAQIFQNSIKFN